LLDRAGDEKMRMRSSLLSFRRPDLGTTHATEDGSADDAEEIRVKGRRGEDPVFAAGPTGSKADAVRCRRSTRQLRRVSHAQLVELDGTPAFGGKLGRRAQERAVVEGRCA